MWSAETQFSFSKTGLCIPGVLLGGTFFLPHQFSTDEVVMAML
jgi:hypothetical protein